MTSESVLNVLASEAERDPLLEMFLLTAIDHYAQSLADLGDEDIRQFVLKGSPRNSAAGINPAAWRQRALQVRNILEQDYGKDEGA